jgi:hypothetical protein
MAHAVTRYQANDGSEWATLEEAEKRDKESSHVALAMKPLRSTPDTSEFRMGNVYVQQKADAVGACKKDLIAATRPFLGRWMADTEANGRDMMDVHPSTFGRFIDDTGSPLSLAWARLWCIDKQCREWGQPYYAEHPNSAATAVAF